MIPIPKIWATTKGKFLRPVILESPYRGKNTAGMARNIRYTKLCCREAFLRYAKVPFASHLLYPQMLDEFTVVERRLGIQGNFIWTDFCQSVVVYIDLGMSPGMQLAVDNATAKKKEIIFRNLYKPWLALVKEN